jgi:GNAT superfamily N-acetyltransferase
MTGVPVVEVHAVAPKSLSGYREQLIAVAAQAFGIAPWAEAPIDAVRLVDGMWCAFGRQDFTAVAALDGPHLVGFAYGYTDTRCGGLDPHAAAPYQAFEVLELAVGSAYQRRGIGRALHDALLADAPGPRLLLTHPEAAARHSYLRWGWADLGEVADHNGQPRVLMRHEPASPRNAAPESE